MKSSATIYRHLVTILGNPVSGGGNNPDFKCPHCLTKRPGQAPGRFHVDIEKDKGLCHKCGTGSKNLQALVVFMGGADYKERLRKESKVAQSEMIYEKFFKDRKPREKKKVEKNFEQGIGLPKEFQPLLPTYRTNKYAEVMFCNLIKRKIPRRIIKRDNIGFCDRGRYDGNIILPVKMRGKVVYFTTRRVFEAGGKTLNPVMPKRPILFNFDTCVKHEIVWVGEGPFDAYSFPNEGVAVLGSYIDDMQVSLFEEMHCKEIVVCLDPDAHNKMEEMALRIWDRYKESKKVSMVYLHGNDDPNDLLADKLQELYDTQKVEFGLTMSMKVKARLARKKVLDKTNR